MFKKGNLIDKLGLPTKILNPVIIKNDLGGNETTLQEITTINVYITSNENSGDRANIANKFGETRIYTAQTTEINKNITIDSILEQNGQKYRIIELDNNAANVSIESEFLITKIGDLTNNL